MIDCNPTSALQHELVSVSRATHSVGSLPIESQLSDVFLCDFQTPRFKYRNKTG
jgi:hypothetical protein